MKHSLNFKGVIDTTFRDGQQSPLLFDSRKYRFTLEDKKTIANGLLQLGVRYFEFFSPIVGGTEADDFAILSGYMKSQSPDVMLLSHVRCNAADIQKAIAAGFDGLNLYLGVNGTAHAKYGTETGKMIAESLTLIQETRKRYPNLYLRFSIEDFFRTPVKNVYAVYDEIAPYVNTLGLPDTVGTATPEAVRKAITALVRRYPKTDLECHFHNDRGLSLVNAVSAIESGAAYIDTSIWGLAERSGITSVTSLLFNLSHEYPHSVKHFNLMLSYPVNVLMGTILNMNVPTTEPVSLTNRTHTAGVHQKAVINDASVYEAHNLSQFGVTKNQLLLGPLSGWNLIYYYLREVKYCEVTRDKAKDIASEFKKHSYRINRHFSPDALLDEIIAKHDISPINVQHEYFSQRIEHLP